LAQRVALDPERSRTLGRGHRFHIVFPTLKTSIDPCCNPGAVTEGFSCEGQGPNLGLLRIRKVGIGRVLGCSGARDEGLIPVVGRRNRIAQPVKTEGL
ncbi:MAG: hypothetical protein QW410_01480, partial [Nitrososphaerota archaeon]